MDLPVEATVHLDIFPNRAEVRQILRSHGFALTDLSGDQVRVKGSFLKLKAAKSTLEQLLNSSDVSPSPKVSSGAVSKHYTRNGSAPESRETPPRASPSSPSSFSPPGSKRPPSPEQRAPNSSGSGRESFVVDVDVFTYADRFRKQDIDGILSGYDVKMVVSEVGDYLEIVLLGKNARKAVGKLQSLLNDLNQMLRTQEVPLKHMDREGHALLERIRRDENFSNSVLVRRTKDALLLIGPSRESFELKQRLLGRPEERAGRTGRTPHRTSRTRSSSLPPASRKDRDGDRGGAADPRPAGAAGYSPSKDRQEAEPERGAAAWFSRVFRRRRRSHSVDYRAKTWPERVHVQEAEIKPPNSPKQNRFMQFVSRTRNSMRRKKKMKTEL